MRNYADDLAFWPWLLERMKPLEDHLVPEDVRIGARLGLAELIRGGTTCFHDMYFHLDQVADEVASAGVRARLCGALFDNSGQGEQLLQAPSACTTAGTARPTGASRSGSRRTRRISAAPYSAGDPRRSRAPECGLHVHVAETEREVAESRERHGVTPVQLLAELGCFGVPTVAAHGIYVDDTDCRLLREGRVSVAHNPGSNLKLANGIAPVQDAARARRQREPRHRRRGQQQQSQPVRGDAPRGAAAEVAAARCGGAAGTARCCAWRRSAARRHSGSIRRSARSRSASRRT